MARQLIRNPQTGEVAEWVPGQGWVKVYTNAPQPGAFESAMIQAGGEVARLGRGVAQMFGADISQGEGEAAMLGEVARAHPVASAVGRSLPAFAVPGGAGGGLLRGVLANAAIGAGYGFIGPGSLQERLQEAGLSGAASALGSAVGSGIGAVRGGVSAGWRESGRSRFGARLGPERTETSIQLEAGPQMTPEQMMARGREAVESLTPEQLATRPAPDASLEFSRLTGRADELGLILTPADVRNSRAGKQWEAAVESHPFTSGIYEPIREHNRRRFSELAYRAIGERVPETGPAELGPSVFGQAHARLADEFDKVAVELGDGITPDAGLVAGVEEVVRGASRSFYGKGQVSADAKRLLELVSKGANGRDLMGWRSEMVTEMRDAARAEGKGAYAADLRGLIGVLDDFIGRYARDNPRLVDTATGEIADVAGRWNAARDQFRMLATLESPGVVNPRGEIVAGTLFRRLQHDYPAEFLRGDMYGSATPAVLDLMDAARVSARFGDIVGNSGTATRQTLSEFIRAPSVGGLMGVAVSQTGGRIVRGVVRNRARRAVLEGYRDAMGKALAERAIAAQAARAAAAGAGGDQ